MHCARLNRDLSLCPRTGSCALIRQEEGLAGFIVKGQRFDVRDPQSYAHAMTEYPKVWTLVLVQLL